MAGAKTKVVVKIDQRLLNPYLVTVTDRSASKAARVVAARARAYAPRDTGALAASINARVISKGVVTSYSVGSNLPYAEWQNKGVPHRIYPVRAKALRFKPKGSNVFVFAKSTRGVPATHFLDRAYESLRVSDFT